MRKRVASDGFTWLLGHVYTVAQSHQLFDVSPLLPAGEGEEKLRAEGN